VEDTYLKELAIKLAGEATEAFSNQYPDEIGMDGDDTEYLAKEFLKALDEFNGNK
jgi:hypothetical protein